MFFFIIIKFKWLISVINLVNKFFLVDFFVNRGLLLEVLA